MNRENVFGYPEPVWARFEAPARAGELMAAADVVVVEAGSPAARGRLRLYAQLAGGRVVDVRFQAYGCPVTIAVGQWVAEQLVGADPRVHRLTAADLRQALEITDDKAHCALMGEDLVLALVKRISG
ncbi:MAG: iron-sulfur cluster assembly scaffold protein [Nevskiales bacterium]|nr:iron-sulfur cluster assembly scaffold protein [Nevskiales bacterium]